MESKQLRIIKIISEQEFVINGGENEGISVGQKFQIIGKQGTEVTDPETGESLGQLDDIKGTITAESVYKRMTLCISPIRRDMVPSAIGMASLKSAFETVNRHIDLNVRDDQITGKMKHSESPIAIGDFVKAIKKSV